MTTNPPIQSHSLSFSSDVREEKPSKKRELALQLRTLKSEFHALNDRQSRHEDQLRESNLHIPPLERMAKTERNFDTLLARVHKLEGRLDVLAEGCEKRLRDRVSAHNNHEDRLHNLENRFSVVAATVHHAHESRLDDLERRTTNIDARHRLSDSKKRALKKAPKGRPR